MKNLKNNLIKSKLCLGPMSKNIVDAIIEYSNENNLDITLIPSRRQIEYNGGYVNNWTTETFTKYIKSKSNLITIQRDHGGPGQGLNDDDGYESLKYDCKYFDSIHIDPWKKYTKFEDGVKWTVDLLNFCYNINPDLYFEVGTEESIRKFSQTDLENLLKDLKSNLKEEIYDKILFCVIQSGTSLKNGINTGIYDETKLKDMNFLIKKYNKYSKEHNGDYMDKNIMLNRFNNNLEALNIAPELGYIETTIILNDLKNNKLYDKIELFFKICLESGKWKKWVNEDFNPYENKEKLIEICGHYVFSHPEFKNIKNIKDKDIINLIKLNIHDFYKIINNKYYNIRSRCCMCDSDDLELLLNNDLKSQLSLNMHTFKNKHPLIPYNILCCKKCNTAQNKYLGNIELVYEINHIDSYGTTKLNKHNLFKSFILNNKEIKSITEIGSPEGQLANNITEESDIEYTIIEFNYKGKKNKKIKIINNFFEDVNINDINSDCLVMSDLFEHFYDPIAALNKIKKCNFKYIILNHPDFDYAVENRHSIMLNIEHTFLIEHQFLFNLFRMNGYELLRRQNYMNFSLFLEFKKSDKSVKLDLFNINTKKNLLIYINEMNECVQKINRYIENNSKQDFYIWPCSVHSCTLFLFGLNYKKLKGILDNSPNKIGKIIDGYNLYCSSFDKLLSNKNENITIFISGANTYISELKLNSNVNIIKINDL